MPSLWIVSPQPIILPSRASWNHISDSMRSYRTTITSAAAPVRVCPTFLHICCSQSIQQHIDRSFSSVERSEYACLHLFQSLLGYKEKLQPLRSIDTLKACWRFLKSTRRDDGTSNRCTLTWVWSSGEAEVSVATSGKPVFTVNATCSASSAHFPATNSILFFCFTSCLLLIFPKRDSNIFHVVQLGKVSASYITGELNSTSSNHLYEFSESN